MPVSDPIADMLTRIRNAQRARRGFCTVPHAKTVRAVVDVLKSEGCITDVEMTGEGVKKQLIITFPAGRGHLTLRRMSTPGRRIYRRCEELKPVLRGFGIAILSTSKGVMTDRRARREGVGGEVICTVIPPAT